MVHSCIDGPREDKQDKCLAQFAAFHKNRLVCKGRTSSSRDCAEQCVKVLLAVNEVSLCRRPGEQHRTAMALAKISVCQHMLI